jgi:cellulose synthase/poly-beta-1,6-N-acetylglucosamine synthase-like glycosyltransferase
MTHVTTPRTDAALVGSAPLPADLSARELLGRGQRYAVAGAGAAVLLVVLLRLLAGVGPAPVWWLRTLVAATITIYLVVIVFRLALVAAAGGAPVLRFGPDDLGTLPAEDLPVYTVLVPLYREAKVLPTLVGKLSALDYPADRLQVLLHIEEDDDQTQLALAGLTLPERFEVVRIPVSLPRTKPKACNVGLTHAAGEFCVIYDAEDRPEATQLRQAVLAFRDAPPWMVCVQAELQYWNPWTNWLTRFFAAEYALNFSMVLRGLDRFRMAIPLGGTSNHFRTAALRQLGGWDPHNVTEDADLGVRIARRGWEVRMMASVTEEEANSRVGNWLRQRSRWIKGYYQTWLVHMRSPLRLWRELGTRRFIGFQLTFGMAYMTLVNPIFWGLTALYIVIGPGLISPLFPPPVLYSGLFTMLVGNLLMVYALMAGCLQRRLHRAVKAMLLVPIYWALMSLAAYKAMYQLLHPRRRHFWELTEHGLVEENG